MVVIRLSRGGSKKRPFYNIVATDRRNRRDGRFIERLGYYNPVAAGQEQEVVISTERLEFWTGNGAQVSESVDRLVRQLGRGGPRPVKAMPSKKAAARAAAEAAAAAAAAEKAEGEAA